MYLKLAKVYETFWNILRTYTIVDSVHKALLLL